MTNNDGPLGASRDKIPEREVAPVAEQQSNRNKNETGSNAERILQFRTKIRHLRPRALPLARARSGLPHNVAGIPVGSAVLLRAEHLHPESAWNQHIPFAFWLVQVHKPSIFVELGTFRGTSYFSICQAVAALRLPTQCFAIDTWQGDEHTGFYDQSVFAQVNACNERKYGDFSRLVRSTFDETLPHFLDGSIDLLHIDGLHTYEACRRDFESWLPKLSERAIVLFHDTNVRECGPIRCLTPDEDAPGVLDDERQGVHQEQNTIIFRQRVNRIEYRERNSNTIVKIPIVCPISRTRSGPARARGNAGGRMTRDGPRVPRCIPHSRNGYHRMIGDL